MSYTAAVNLESTDRVGRVVVNREGALTTARTCARSIELRDRASLSAKKTVIHATSVNDSSCDRPDALMLNGSVPWNGPVPPPETSNSVKVPSGERT